MENRLDVLKKDAFALSIGISILEVGEGCAKGKMEITPTHLNGVGTVQGGALFTLADYICAVAANSREKSAVSLDGHIDFIKAVSSGTLIVTAKEVFLRRTIAAYMAEIRREEDNVLVATFQSKFYRKE
ncbi:MAG: PaaI family thioesterase [Paludibacteraceae bacterium]|nr:PaaI family thioesterase [Paludibacteraceae bacterium]